MFDFLPKKYRQIRQYVAAVRAFEASRRGRLQFVRQPASNRRLAASDLDGWKRLAGRIRRGAGLRALRTK